MATGSVCRLCMSDKELVWVFDNQSNSEEISMKTVIFLTTGVEISERDVITQKICKHCSVVTGKIYNFRERANKTDKYLKEEFSKLLQNSSLKMPNSNITIKKRKHDSETNTEDNRITIKRISPALFKKSKIDEIKETEIINVDTETEDNAQENSTEKTTKVPCFSREAYVSLEMGCVEKYFKDKNIDMNKHIRLVKRSPKSGDIKKNSVNVIIKDNLLIQSPNNLSSAQLDDELEKNSEMATSDSSKVLNDKNANALNIISAERETLNNIDINPQNTSVEHNTSININTNPINVISAPSEISISANKNTQNEIHTEPDISEAKQIDLHTCNICNVTTTSRYKLKKHRRIHFNCPYCRIKYRNPKFTDDHVKRCYYKKVLESRPYIELEKINLKYYEGKYNIKITNLEDYSFDEVTDSEEENVAIDEDVDVVELTNSEYETTNIEISVTKRDNIAEIRSIENDTIEYQLNGTDQFHVIIELSDDEEDDVKDCEKANVSTPKEVKTTNILPNENALTKTNEPPGDVAVIEEIKVSSTALVKPSIRLISDTILDNTDTSQSERIIVKELLKKKQDNHIFFESVVEDNKKCIKKIKNLKSNLQGNSIPIKIKSGAFNGWISKANNIKSNEKVLNHWNASKPIDLQETHPIFNSKNLNDCLKQGGSLFKRQTLNENVFNLTTGIIIPINNIATTATILTNNQQMPLKITNVETVQEESSNFCTSTPLIGKPIQSINTSAHNSVLLKNNAYNKNTSNTSLISQQMKSHNTTNKITDPKTSSPTTSFHSSQNHSTTLNISPTPNNNYPKSSSNRLYTTFLPNKQPGNKPTYLQGPIVQQPNNAPCLQPNNITILPNNQIIVSSTYSPTSNFQQSNTIYLSNSQMVGKRTNLQAPSLQQSNNITTSANNQFIENPTSRQSPSYQQLNKTIILTSKQAVGKPTNSQNSSPQPLNNNTPCLANKQTVEKPANLQDSSFQQTYNAACLANKQTVGKTANLQASSFQQSYATCLANKQTVGKPANLQASSFQQTYIATCLANKQTVAKPANLQASSFQQTNNASFLANKQIVRQPSNMPVTTFQQPNTSPSLANQQMAAKPKSKVSCVPRPNLKVVRPYRQLVSNNNLQGGGILQNNNIINSSIASNAIILNNLSSKNNSGVNGTKKLVLSVIQSNSLSSDNNSILQNALCTNKESINCSQTPYLDSNNDRILNNNINFQYEAHNNIDNINNGSNMTQSNINSQKSTATIVNVSPHIKLAYNNDSKTNKEGENSTCNTSSSNSSISTPNNSVQSFIRVKNISDLT